MMLDTAFPPQIDSQLKLSDGLYLDLSGKGNTLTNNGSTLTTDHRGRANKAFSFDRASSQYISSSNIPSLTATANFTLIMTFRKGASTLSNQMLFANSNAFSDRIAVFWSSNTIRAGYYDGTAYSKSAALNVDSDWQFLVLRRNGTGNVFASLNGVEMTDSETSGSSGAVGLTIGCRTDITYYFDGVIEEILGVSRALSDSDISQLYNEWRK